MPKNNRPVCARPFSEAFREYKKEDESLDFTGEFESTIHPGACVLNEQLYLLHARANENDQLIAATFINSFRLECRDCLNEECSQRDPDSPVSKVIEREKHFQEEAQQEATRMRQLEEANKKK